MATKLGRMLLLKIGDGGSPEAFDNVCGVKTRELSIDNETIDVTQPNCLAPGNKLETAMDYGVQTVSCSVSGEASDEATQQALKSAAFDQGKPRAQLVVPGDGTFEGALILSSFKYSGEMTGTMKFSAEMTFSGGVSYTAET